MRAKILCAHSDEVWFLQFSNNGKYLASASTDKSAIIWKVDESGELLPKHVLTGHEKPVMMVAWSPDDCQLLTCGMEEAIRRWDVESGKCIHVYEKPSLGPMSCGWFPDGKQILCGLSDQSLCLWDLDGKQADCWKGLRISKTSDFAVAKDGKLIITTNSDCTILLLNRDTKQERLVEEDCTITSFSLSEDGDFLLVNLITEKIHLWNIRNDPILVKQYTGHKRSRFVIRSCFGGFEQSFIASGSEDSKVYIWHRASGDVIETLSGHSGAVNCHVDFTESKQPEKDKDRKRRKGEKQCLQEASLDSSFVFFARKVAGATSSCAAAMVLVDFPATTAMCSAFDTFVVVAKSSAGTNTIAMAFAGMEVAAMALVVVVEAQPLPAWILTGPAALNLYADEEVEPADDAIDVDDPALAAPPPPLPCPVHGWVCPRLAQQGIHVEEEAKPVVPEAASLDLPSPTPAHEPAPSSVEPATPSAGLAPMAVRDAVLDNDAGGSAAAAQPPQRCPRFIVPRAVLQASRAGRRPGEWSPARLDLSNGHSNSVAPGTQLPGGSSDEDEGGWGINRRR
ncbi:hypothetical protein QYE76_033586 [Lolium multiflorum]|uniref:Uncharacterized protein n=1 Tax=Lolium multiflorum TaxID=4521 RepID=A0AAD8QZD8_LOLMU|nr:hypothetical protein QYE76_033586 [Lolium multiflorum]